MLLSKPNLTQISAPGLLLPGSAVFGLPEKVLQFGTGVLLRGLPDYFIDNANRQGVFNGRIVVVKSTDVGSSADFDQQDGLYTIYSKGIEDGRETEEQIVCSSISRVLSAASDWASVLELAKNPDLQVVISNTTEVGIQLTDEPISLNPPQSFPGKLLALLYERYKAFGGSAESGWVIIPTELIVDNGKKLEAIVLELAQLNNLEPEFIAWLKAHNTFCSSLVDRIVPGKPALETVEVLEAERGYTDNLHITSEIYRLWAIEGNEKVADILSFAQVDKGVVVTPDIGLFRELKLRVLNGTHTLSCAFAVVSGLATVKDAMNDEFFLDFINGLVYEEIIPSIPYDVDPAVAADFAAKVLDRFRNPHIRHEWLSISVQYTAKLKMRVVPLLLKYYEQKQQVPPYMAMGFAAYLRLLKVKQNEPGTFTGKLNGQEYTIKDDSAALLASAWSTYDTTGLVYEILSNQTLWGADLTALPAFRQAVTDNLKKIIVEGIKREKAIAA